MVIGEEPPPPSVNLYSRGPSPVNDVVGGTTSRIIRTKSMHQNMSIWNGAPTSVTYQIPEHPTKAELEEYLTRNEIHGYGEGAVVVGRWQRNGFGYVYPHQWGTIFHTFRSPHHSPFWGPYQVKWFDGQIESTWAEDLVVIHACLSKELLFDILSEQGVDITEAKNTHERMQIRSV